MAQQQQLQPRCWWWRRVCRAGMSSVAWSCSSLTITSSSISTAPRRATRCPASGGCDTATAWLTAGESTCLLLLLLLLGPTTFDLSDHSNIQVRPGPERLLQAGCPSSHLTNSVKALKGRWVGLFPTIEYSPGRDPILEIWKVVRLISLLASGSECPQRQRPILVFWWSFHGEEEEEFILQTCIQN